jgi:hypothetical protein
VAWSDETAAVLDYLGSSSRPLVRKVKLVTKGDVRTLLLAIGADQRRAPSIRRTLIKQKRGIVSAGLSRSVLSLAIHTVVPRPTTGVADQNVKSAARPPSRLGDTQGDCGDRKVFATKCRPPSRCIGLFDGPAAHGRCTNDYVALCVWGPLPFRQMRVKVSGSFRTVRTK